MNRCPTCGQLEPSASWNAVAFELAMEEFRTRWLDEWNAANEALVVKALGENDEHDAQAWERVLSPPLESPSFRLRLIGERRPEVEWLSGCPSDIRRWWGEFTLGRDWLTRSYPSVTEEEWAAILD